MTQQTATGLRGTGAPRTALTTALRLPDASVSVPSLAAYGLALLATAVATAMIATRSASSDEPVAALRQAD